MLKNRVNSKVYIPIFSLVFAFHLTASAAPEITFQRFWDVPFGVVTSPPNPRGNHGVFSRALNNNQQLLFTKLEEGGYAPKEFTLKNKNILEAHFSQEFSESSRVKFRAYYTFDKTAQVQGYLLMEPLLIYNDESYDESSIRQMKQLPRNEALLNNISVPNSVELSVFEKKSEGFIERYIFLQAPTLTDMNHILLVDAYYPEALDSDFTRKSLIYVKQFLKEMSFLYD